MRVMVQRASGVGLAFAVAAVAATAFLASNAFATFPGANGRIAFVGSGVPGCTQERYQEAICTMEPDGSGLKRLSTFGSWPSWSANGRRIVFSGRWIHTMKADGTDKTKVASTGGNSNRSAAFSPSGGRIVYNHYRANAPQRRRGAIYTIRTDGTRKRLVFASGAIPETPGYSPDGRRIVFAGRPNHRPWGIWTIRPDGTGRRPVTTNPPSAHYCCEPRTDHYPDWSPDGSQIEFVRYIDCDERSCSKAVKFIRPDGSGLHGNGEVGESRYRYAPSGDRLVSQVSGPESAVPPTCSDIFTVPVVGGDRTTVTDNCVGPDFFGFAYEPSWQPLPGG
jgi:Tol biopolymer transport system component